VPAILSDCKDTWEDRTRVTGNILACANTTQSLVMSPDDDTLWLAKADHPVSHADSYAGFRISALLNADRDNYVCAPIAGGSTLDATQREALHEYEEAWSEHFDNDNNDKAIFHLRRAAALLPEETIFPRMAGILLLQQHRYDQALPLLIKNTEYEYKDALMRAEAHMWVARCLDLLARRTEALAQYQKVIDLNAAPLSAAARRHLSKPFRKLGLIDVSPEFICGTALAKYKV
jgi:tetratricopeptide (TPR) repeat protein